MRFAKWTNKLSAKCCNAVPIAMETFWWKASKSLMSLRDSETSLGAFPLLSLPHKKDTFEAILSCSSEAQRLNPAALLTT